MNTKASITNKTAESVDKILGSQHPPMVTPWKCVTELDREYYRVRNASGLTVATCHYKEHAAFIVKAVNSHEELVEALKQAIGYIEDRIQPTISFRGLVERIEGKELPFNMKKAIAEAEAQ